MQALAKTTWRPSPPVPAREDCTLCQGTGWQLVTESGLSQARRCSCGMLVKIVRLKESVRIPQRYEHCTLDEYKPCTASQFKALTEARRFVARFPHADKGLFFWGARGTGKTHLAVGILLELLQRFQEDILFIDFRSFSEPGWRISQRSEGKTPDLVRLKTSSLLVLDDFAPASISTEAMAAVREILSARIHSGRLTIFTAGRSERGRTAHGSSHPDESCWRLLPIVFHPQLAAQLMSSVKTILISGENLRDISSAAATLFQCVHNS